MGQCHNFYFRNVIRIPSSDIFPTLLVGLVLGTVGAQKLYISTSSLLGGASKYLSKERIEKEPISLVGEVLAALVFLFVCAYGVFGPRP